MLGRIFGTPETPTERAVHRDAAAEAWLIGAEPEDWVARRVAWMGAGWDYEPTPKAILRNWTNLAQYIPEDWEGYPVGGGDLVAGDLLDDRTGADA